MNTTEFRDWLEERIRIVGTELEELLCARRALDKAEAQQAPKSPPVVRAARKPYSTKALGIQKMVIAFLRDHGATANQPITAANIHRMIGGKWDKKQIGNALYHASTKGHVSHDADNRWFIVEQHEPLKVAVNG